MHSVLIAGGAGFIGGSVAKLMSQEFKVTIVDNLTSSLYNNEERQLFVESLSKTRASVEFLETGMEELSSSFLSGFDAIVNLAAIPGLRNSWSQSEEIWRSNVSSLQKLLEQVALLETKPIFVQASTSSVYGQYASGGEESPVRPASPYGLSKLAAENLIALYSEKTGFRYTNLRLFSVYGPRQRPDMAFNKAFNSILEGSDFFVFGDGGQVRSNTFVEDVSSAFTSAVRQLLDGKHLPHAINIAGDECYSLTRSLELIAQVVDQDLNMSYKDVIPGDQVETSGDTSLASRELNWIANTRLQDGLEAQWRWHQRRFDS